MKIRLGFLFSVLLFARGAGQVLIHYYDFNGASVTDLAGTDNGTLNNGASLSGGKLVLDGTNDTVSFATRLVPSSGAFSVAFFAQTPALSGGYVELISQGSSGAPGFYIGYAPSHIIRLSDNIGNTGISYPSDGANHHFALTYDGSSTRFYIDGSLAGTFGGIGVTNSGDNTLFGAQFQGFGEYFGGTIDEMRIYTGVLSSTDVSTLAAIPESALSTSIAGLAALGLFLRRRQGV